MIVLLVEDEPALEVFLQDLLETEGIPCLTAADLDEADWILAVAAVDVLIVDLGIGGQDALAWLEGMSVGQQRLCGPPIVLAEAELERERALRLEGIGATVLQKPRARLRS